MRRHPTKKTAVRYGLAPCSRAEAGSPPTRCVVDWLWRSGSRGARRLSVIQAASIRPLKQPGRGFSVHTYNVFLFLLSFSPSTITAPTGLYLSPCYPPSLLYPRSLLPCRPANARQHHAGAAHQHLLLAADHHRPAAAGARIPRQDLGPPTATTPIHPRRRSRTVIVVSTRQACR